MGEITGRQRYAHLLRRTGFGGSPAEIDAAMRMGWDAAIDQIVDFDQVSNDNLEADVAAVEATVLAQPRPQLAAIQAIWLYRMLNTARPLEERMTLFWHDHFATANYKVANPAAMYAQNQLIRSNALGSFRTLLSSIARDPAMLRWLDSNSNRRASPNENFARELQELFTMGVGSGYTETDVREAARAFTGWFFDRNQGFVFNRNQHDADDKTYLGRTGPFDGDDIINIILEQPVTAEYMATKLFGFFVHDHPTPSRIAALADTFRGSDYNVRELVRSILHSPEFASDEAYHALVKSPVEYVVGTMKALGIGDYARGPQGNMVVQANLNRMGMALFNPPDVAGWRWGVDWIGSDTLLERLNTASQLVTLRGDNARYGLDPTAVVAQHGGTPTQIVDGLLRDLVDGDVSGEVRNGLVNYMLTGYGGKTEDFAKDTGRVDRTVRAVAHLIMSTPVYQMA
jgi:uncharacterized protein (DUF1800 family)